ncbi:MAG: hypothetical protein WC389_22200 [Lutibacter sp.]
MKRILILVIAYFNYFKSSVRLYFKIRENRMDEKKKERLIQAQFDIFRGW